MKNSSKCKHNTGIYIRKEEGLYSVYSKQGQFMPWALDTKKGRPFSWTRVQYVALLHSIFPRLPCNAWKNRSS